MNYLSVSMNVSHYMFYIKKCSATEAGFWESVCGGILPKPYIKVRVRYRVTPGRVGLVNGLSRQRAAEKGIAVVSHALLAEHFKCEAISIVLG